MAPDGTPNAGGRNAEHAARRTSSCAFADNVAAAAMRAYDAVLAHLADRDPSRSTERGQTVLAAVVARDARCVPPRLRVVSLGAGTKFMRAADIDADALSGTKVRDCHAEVLARRGMKRFLYAQIRSARRRSRDAEDARRGGETRKRHEPPVAVEEEEWLVLEPVPNDAASDAASESWRVRPEVSFHLYASSAPCGNATVKRWARGAKETFDDTLGPFELPARSGRDPADDEHDKKHNSFGSVAEGQLAFLWKRDPSESRPDDNDDDDDARRRPAPVAGPVAAVPPGTSTRGRVLTCSDKLAVWSCVGVQGALLLARGFLAEPVRFASVTVGRKFNRAVGRRALCCRVRGFARRARFPFAAPPARRALSGANETDAANETGACTPIRSGTAHHPTLLCTAALFDAGRYAEGEGADFGSGDAVVAWLGAGAGAGAGESPSERSYVRALAAAAELLNGRTGERIPVPAKDECVVSKGKPREIERGEAAATVSGVSRAALAAAHAAGEARSGAEGAWGPSGTPNAGGSAYAARKAEAGASSGYAEAKREALSQPGLWSLSAPHRLASTTRART